MWFPYSKAARWKTPITTGKFHSCQQYQNSLKNIAKQLHIYLETTGLLQKTQSWFRKHHSCQTALINIVDSWLKCIDEGNLIGSVFIDFKKAFDLVDHEILLYKLKLYHFDDLSCALFSSYLQNRSQLVKAENTVS